MFGWVRQQVKEHGVFAGMRLVGQVAVSRIAVNLANKCLPPVVMCPCCGWRGRRFYDYFEIAYRVPNAMCPQCESHSRHRGLFLWISKEFDLAAKRGLALNFAPEKSLANLWAEAPYLKVCNVDLSGARGVDLIADLQRLPITSGSVDLISCHHVLEHIEKDRVAIKELARVLRPEQGILFVSVPMELGRPTDEYGHPDPKQCGHWRMYGDDFAERLTEGGLSVQAIDIDWSSEELQRYAVTPERFYVCRRPVNL